MKKITIIIVLLACLTTALFSWDIARQTQFPSTFTAMSKAGNNFWSVGSGGAVVKSTDEGLTWQFVPTPAFDANSNVYVQLNAVSFADEMHGAVAGNDGFLAYTSDGGNNWTQSGNAGTIFGGGDIKSLAYLPSGKIIAAGESGTMMFSENHGVNFTSVTTPVSTTINTVYFEEDGMTLIGCGSGIIKKSLAFGASWTDVVFGNSNNPNIYQIRKNGNRIFLTGNKGYVGFTDNNCESFTHYNSLGSATNSIYDIASDGTTAYAVGSNGYLFKSTDNFNTSENITTINTSFSNPIRGAYFNSSNQLLVTASYGTLMRWDDANQLWMDLVVNAYDFYGISVASNDTWFAVGDEGLVVKTANGGQTYSVIHLPLQTDDLFAVKFFDENLGFITGKTTGKIYKTVNGGQDWTYFTVPNVLSSKSYRKLSFVNDQIGYAIGGVFNAKTTDGGANWTMTTNTGIGTTSLVSGFFKSENVGFAGANNGTLFVTTDGAQTWTSFTKGGGYIYDILFWDDNNGIFVTSNSEIFYTTTGGLTADSWIAATEPTVGSLYGVSRLADGTLYAAGYSTEASQMGTSNAILKSIDNGLNWTAETLPELTFNPTQLTAINAKDNTIIASGKNQVLYKEMIQTEEIYATDLFISEYIEGSSNNKAIEIFNGTGQPVDLSNYTVKLGANGLAWSTVQTMNGILAHGEVYIIANSSANATILALADTTSTVTFYNGNDALGLFHNDSLIDLFGDYNVLPATNFVIAGLANGALDHTLIRKPNVISPTTDWALSAGTDTDNSQWIIQPVNYLDDLGMHTFTPSAPTAVSAPTFTPASGTFYNPIDVVINCSTDNASIFYTLDGTDPSENSLLYSTPITITTTTTIKAKAFLTGMTASSISTSLYTINVPVEVSNIGALRSSTPDNSTVYKLTGEAVLTFKQTYRFQKYIQDASAAIMIDDMTNIFGSAYNIYDGITGITGKLTEFGGMLEFIPVIAGTPATSTNNVITPQIITVAQFNTSFEDYESELVKIENLDFLSSGTFANGQIYNAITGQDTLQFRTTFYDVNYIGDPIPANFVNVIGICNSRVDGNYFTARDSADFSNSNLVTNPPQTLSYVLNENVVSLNWLAPTAGSTGSFVGYNVYRNNSLLTQTVITALTYNDTPTAGQYNYHVKAVYSNPDRESNPSNAVQVTIEGEELYPPTGLTASVVDNDVTLNWIAAGPEDRNYDHSKKSINSEAKLNDKAKLLVSKKAMNSEKNRDSRNLLGYKVYRGTTLLTTTPLPITSLTYQDLDLAEGTYTYNVTAVYPENESVPASVEAVVTVPYVINIFPWNEGFEGTFPTTGWMNVDNDNDTYMWEVLENDTTDTYSHSGSKCIGSASYINAPGPGALTPDNWYITPKIQLPVYGTNQTAKLKFWIAAQDPAWPEEHYSVLLSTTNSNIASFTTSLISETLSSGDWTEKTIDLENYSNQAIYLAFRHHACTDMFIMKLDDVSIALSSANDNSVVSKTLLKGNYPNPFNPSTTIAYAVKEKANVTLEVYNIKGQKVRTLVNEIKNQGNYTILWNGQDDNHNNAGSGIYFYRMKSGNFTATGKMILMK